MLSSSFGRVWIADSAGLRLVMVLQLVQVAVALVASYTQFRSWESSVIALYIMSRRLGRAWVVD